LGLEVLKVDSQGTAGANGVLKGDNLVALNGRTIPTNMPDKDLAVIYSYLLRESAAHELALSLGNVR